MIIRFEARRTTRLARFCGLVLAIALTTAVFPSWSAVVSGLYEVRLPVSGKSSGERQQMLQQAFEELLIRLTGNRNIAAQPSARALLDKSSQFIRQFRYEVDNQPRYGRPSIALGATPEVLPTKPVQMLWVQFDEAMVKDAVHQAKLPLWGATRPNTLVWLAVQDYDQRFLVDRKQLSDAADSVKLAAAQRGLPIVLPLVDEQDLARANLTDIWGDFADQILDASARYESEAILTGRVSVDAFGVWQGRWTLYHDGASTSWSSEQRDLNEAVKEGFSGVADRLAVKYASRRTQSTVAEVLMEIQNVTKINDYVRAGKYLASLAAISKYQIVQMSDSFVVYRVVLSGDRDNLNQVIGLSKVLSPARASNTTGDNVLAYQLAP